MRGQKVEGFLGSATLLRPVSRPFREAIDPECRTDCVPSRCLHHEPETLVPYGVVAVGRPMVIRNDACGFYRLFPTGHCKEEPERVGGRRGRDQG